MHCLGAVILLLTGCKPVESAKTSGAVYCVGRGFGDVLRRVCRAWPEENSGELRTASSGKQGVRWAIVASAAQAEHVGRDSADLRVFHHLASGYRGELVQCR